MKTNIQNIADKLAGAWARHNSWMKVAEAAVECACKPETSYRHLNQGEVIQIGDQWSIKGSDWQPCTEWIGCVLQNPDFEVRRRMDDSADCRDALKAATSSNLSFSKKVDRLKDVNADQRVQIEHLEKRVAELESRNKVLADEAAHANNVWREIYEWIHSNVRGCMGKRCCDVALELLKNNAAVVADKDLVLGAIELDNSKLQAVVADKDATIARLKEKLEAAEPFVLSHVDAQFARNAAAKISEQETKLGHAAVYITKLEQDLSFYTDAADAACKDADYYRAVINKAGGDLLIQQYGEV